MNFNTVKNKLRIFISSKIGGNYNIIRSALKTLLEETGLVNVYTFESSGARSRSAKIDYSTNIDESHVCIFLIDNSINVPDAVMDEHTRAKLLNKRRLYFFCDETEKTPTSLEKDIESQGYPKFFPVTRFSDFPTVAYQHLLRDLVECYFPHKVEISHPEKTQNSLPTLSTHLLLDKKVFKSYSISDPFIQIFNIYSSPIDFEDIESSYEKHASFFLLTLLGRTEFDESSFLQLETLVLEDHPEAYREIIGLRFKAIHNYFTGELSACERTLEKIYSRIINEQSIFPEWLKNDILIDWRNVTSFIDSQNNNLNPNSKPQEILQESRESVYYPLLDRYADNCRRSLLNEFFVDATQSPYSFRYTSFGQYVRDLTACYNIALRFGSLIHLLQIREKYAEVLFTLFHQDEDFILFINLSSMYLLSQNVKALENLITTYRHSVSAISANDIRKLINTVNTIPISRNRELAYCELMRHFGLYFNESQFISSERRFWETSFTWLNNKEKTVRDGYYFFRAINSNILRLDNQEVAKFLNRCFELKLFVFSDEIFDVLQQLSLDDVAKLTKDSLINNLFSAIQSKNTNENLKLVNAIISFREQVNEEVKLEFDKAVKEHLKQGYVDEYDFSIGRINFLTQLNSFLEQADRRNNEAVKGTYRGYYSNCFDSIRILIYNTKSQLSKKDLNRIINTIRNTIFNTNQEADNKVAAMFLLIYLKAQKPDSVTLTEFYEETKQNSGKILQATFSDTSGISTYNALFFTIFLLKNSFDEFNHDEAVSIFSSMIGYKEAELIAVLRLLHLYLQIVEVVDQNQMFLQLSVQLLLGIGSKRHKDTQYFAVLCLLFLFQNNLFTEIISKRMIVLIDNVVSEIKLAILRSIDIKKFTDIKTLEYIVQKGRIDNHYLVKKKAEELTLQLAELQTT